MIVITLLTCDRPKERIEYARLTMKSLGNLTSDEDIHLHIADDGSSQEFRDELIKMAREIFGDNTSITNSEGTGYGGNYNKSTQVTHKISDILLPLEDDWIVKRKFNLDPFVKLLREGVYECIRMGYIGYTDELRATFEYHDKNHYLRLDPNSPERHVFAGGPRLETREFEIQLGAWPMNMGAGATELEVAKRKEARKSVAWPIGMISLTGHPGDLFVHSGTVKAVTGATK